MDIFSGLDSVTKILSLGISGFCFLLVYLSYRIIQKEQERPVIRTEIFKPVYVFMAINFLNVVVVGILGLPAISRNQDLQEANQQQQQQLSLNRNQFSFFEQSIKLKNHGDKVNDGRSPASVEKDTTELANSFLKAIDSLQSSYADNRSPLADSLMNIRNDLAKEFIVFESDTAQYKTKRKAFIKFNDADKKLSKLVFESLKLEKMN